MTRNGHHARLTAVEAALAAGSDDPLKAEAARFDAAITTIIKTMAPEHVEILAAGGGERLAQEVRGRAAWVAMIPASGTGYITPAGWVQSSLAAQGYNTLGPSIDDMRGRTRPLALPREVAEVYIRDPGALSNSECVECHYQLPVKCGWPPSLTQRDSERPAGPCDICGRHMLHMGKPRCGGRLYFESCPLCGAAVAGYEMRRQQERLRQKRRYG